MLTNQQRLFESFSKATGVWRLRTEPYLNPFSTPTDAKWITLTESSLVDDWKFYVDSSESSLLKTITITYTASNKKTIQSIEVTP